MQDDKIFSVALIETLKRERKERGLSHEKLAKLAGLSRQAIGVIESGKINPTMQTVYKLVTAMDMKLDDFVKRMKIG
ncbi:MAG: helix-turn-helix transcriptional regulator [Rickettsiales bacterium]|nr:helix-turn-helix transcriptional regulator [Rickettsiales bacterium]